MTPAASAASIRATLERFVAGFNANMLDEVMPFFADDAVYQSVDGERHVGRAAIRAAFAPQFAGAFGAMRFHVDDWIVDEPARKATIRWVCTHDLSSAWRYRLLFGRRVGWLGADVFHFDGAGRITAKCSYLTARRPRLRRELAR